MIHLEIHTTIGAPGLGEQIKGPFKTFRHVHLFAEADGATTMTDDITFSSPVGPG